MSRAAIVFAGIVLVVLVLIAAQSDNEIRASKPKTDSALTTTKRDKSAAYNYTRSPDCAGERVDCIVNKDGTLRCRKICEAG